MGSVAPQLDLFAPPSTILFEASALPPVNSQAEVEPRRFEAIAWPAGPDVARSLTAGGREWTERTLLAWSRRANAIRAAIEAGDNSRGAANRLFAMEWHVRRLREALGGPDVCAPAVAAIHAPADAEAVPGGPIAAELERLRASLERWRPRFGSKLGAQVNDGPISAEIRAQLQAKIDALEGGG